MGKKSDILTSDNQHLALMFNSGGIEVDKELPKYTLIKEEVEEFAKRIAKNKHLKAKHLFIRTANTVQVGSDRATRLAQAEHAFTLNPKTRISPDTTYILFDDVWTTGASMNAAIKKLREAGAKRIIVTLLATSSLD